MKYHILYRKSQDSPVTGINIEADSALSAIKRFNIFEPDTNTMFVAMYCIENSSALLSHQLSEPKEVKSDRIYP